MNCFILKSNERMRKGVPWNVVVGFVNDFAQKVRIEPTQESIRKGHLEWMIPDTAHNRAMAAGNYSAYLQIETEQQLASNPVADQKAKIELDEVKTENIDLKSQMQVMMDKIAKLEENANANADAVPLVDGDSDITETTEATEDKPLNPNEIKKLKDELKVKLTAKGLTYPPTATLPMLQDLAKDL